MTEILAKNYPMKMFGKRITITPLKTPNRGIPQNHKPKSNIEGTRVILIPSTVTPKREKRTHPQRKLMPFIENLSNAKDMPG